VAVRCALIECPQRAGPCSIAKLFMPLRYLITTYQSRPASSRIGRRQAWRWKFSAFGWSAPFVPTLVRDPGEGGKIKPGDMIPKRQLCA
jgi:hypothetical protein